jgi:hypothetical protein
MAADAAGALRKRNSTSSAHILRRAGHLYVGTLKGVGRV